MLGMQEWKQLIIRHAIALGFEVQRVLSRIPRNVYRHGQLHRIFGGDTGSESRRTDGLDIGTAIHLDKPHSKIFRIRVTEPGKDG